MKKFIIQNAIVNINNEKINILILENKEKIEKYILYISNLNNTEISNLPSKFNKFEFKDNISITPKKKFIDSKIEIFNNSSTKKHSLLLNKKQIYFTLNPHITLNNENIIIDDNFKLIKSDSTLYNFSKNLYLSNKSNEKSYEDDLISKILKDNKNKIEEKTEYKELINSVKNKLTEVPLENIFKKEDSLEDVKDYSIKDATENASEDALEDGTENASKDALEDVKENASEDALEDALEDVKENASENALEDATENASEDATEDALEDATEDALEDVKENASEDVKENASENALEDGKENALEDALKDALKDGTENATEDVLKDTLHDDTKDTLEIKEKDETIQDTIENVLEKEENKEELSDIKIINLNSKITPTNSEILLPDCKEIKIIDKKIEDDKEIKNIEILKMDNVENKLKNIFDLDKIMTDFNNLFNDLSNEEKKTEIEKKIEKELESKLPKNQNISSKKVHFSEQNSVLSNIEKIPEFKEEIKKQMNKENNLLYNKLVNYQNINYKIPTIRILPTQNLNFNNLYTSQIHENNILLNPNLSIELGKDNLSYLIKIGNQKYLINKVGNSIVLTNLFNKNSQII